jgi:hypothetical protein
MGNDVPYDVATLKGRSPRFRCSGSWTTRRCFATVRLDQCHRRSRRVLQMWSKEFIAMHRENGCFVLTCHPFISGRRRAWR